MKKTFVYFHMEGEFRAVVLEAEHYIAHGPAKDMLLQSGMVPKDGRVLLEYR